MDFLKATLSFLLTTICWLVTLAAKVGFIELLLPPLPGNETLSVGIIDGRDPGKASDYVGIQPERAMTADEVLVAVFQIGSPEVLKGIQLAIEQ